MQQVTVHYPNPEDKENAVIRMGDLEISASYSEAKEQSATFLQLHNSGVQTATVIRSNGNPCTICGSLIEEFYAALVEIIVEVEVGEMLI